MHTVAVRPVTGYRSSEGQAKLPFDTASLPPSFGASRCPDALHTLIADSDMQFDRATAQRAMFTLLVSK